MKGLQVPPVRSFGAPARGCQGPGRKSLAWLQASLKRQCLIAMPCSDAGKMTCTGHFSSSLPFWENGVSWSFAGSRGSGKPEDRVGNQK